MHFVDDWIDLGRVVIFFLSLWCCYTLLRRLFANLDNWNTKTKDLWYSMFMWSVVGIVSMSQGVLLDRPLTPTTVVISAAVLVTGKGLHRKGSWGGVDD